MTQKLWGLVVVFAGCGGAATPVGSGGQPDLPDLAIESSADLAMMVDASSVSTDDDQDGLDDAQELTWARDYLPYISHSPTEDCKTGGLLVRVRKHPMDPTLIHIFYDYLYDQDCGTAIGGIGGHPGDDEGFAITVDPTQPAPVGMVAMKAISHQGTPCERDSTCGRCSGLTPCETLPIGGTAWPAVWPSKDKHGSYVSRGASCGAFATCFDQCEDATSPTVPMIVNAGEPDHPLIHDLTVAGLITQANGWQNMELFHFDPWGNHDFGSAGNVTGDLTDPAFLTPACH